MTPNCKQCAADQDVTFGPDPYAADVHDDDTPVWLCEKCREENAWEI